MPVDWLKRLGIHDILGVKVEEWDYLYSGIYFDEVIHLGPWQCMADSCSWHGPVWLGLGRPSMPASPLLFHPSSNTAVLD